jgi:hypothetical protein
MIPFIHLCAVVSILVSGTREKKPEKEQRKTITV